MVIKTYFDKNNTLLYNDLSNTGLNPVAELFYGGDVSNTKYSRFLFYFDESRLKQLYSGGTMPDLSKMRHTLNITNTSAFDLELLNQQTPYGKDRSSSFDLVLFKVNQAWDEGTGYDYQKTTYIGGVENTLSMKASNWVEAQNHVYWANGNGVYTGSPTDIQVTTIHLDKGNENIEVDITDTVNDYLSGGSINYGLGLAFTRVFEETPTDDYQYVGFFTRHTQTFFEPYLETRYLDNIRDDRNDFFMDKTNKLCLYVNVNGEPTNLDSLPIVIIKDNSDIVISAITSTTLVIKGVYSVDVEIPESSGYTDGDMFTDIWSGITINGKARPDATLEFILKGSNCYYNIGDEAGEPRKFSFNVTGIKNGERIVRGDVRKVNILARIPYTVNQSQIIDTIQYRLYVMEGKGEVTVIDYDDVHRTNKGNYFLLDTNSLLPQTYYLDIKLTSNDEVTVSKGVLKFEIVGINKYK